MSFLILRKNSKAQFVLLNLPIPNVTHEKWLTFENARKFGKVSHFGPKRLTRWKMA